MKKTLILIIVFCLGYMNALEAQGTWSETYLSETKDHMARAVLGSKVYFAGGYAYNETTQTWFKTNKVEIYDAETDTWTYDQFSEGRDWVEGVTAGNKVFFAGGGDNAENIVSTVDIYDALTDEWTVTNLSMPRLLLSPVSVAEKVLFAGGSNLEDTQSQVDVYNTNTGEWSTTELSEGRMSMGSAAIGDLAFFAGGFVWHPSTGVEYVTNRVDIYNAATNTWDTASLSEPRSFIAATVVGNKVLFAGGLTALGPSNRVDIYDVTTGTWSIDSLSVARGFEVTSQNAVTIGNKAYFVGGVWRYWGNYYADFNVIDIYDSVTNTWETDYLPYNLFGHSVAGVNGKLIVAGGISLAPLEWNFHNQVLIKQVVTSVEFSTHQVGSFDVFPNPAVDAFVVQLPADIPTTDLRMLVYDQYGRLVMQRNGIDVQHKCDISQWQTGFYFIRLEGKGLNAVNKLLKIK